MTDWLPAFLVTELLEAPFYLAGQPGRPWPRRAVVALAASALTHPFVWFVFPRLIDPYEPMLLAAESFAVLVEAAWLRAFSVPCALLLSLAANATSLCLGLLMRHTLGWP